MNIDEIESYILRGRYSAVCVFRERLEGLNLFIQSFYITGKPESYSLNVEFDPINMVDNGEGWVWSSESMPLPILIKKLENYLKLGIEDWVNVTKSGYLSFYDGSIDIGLYKQQESIFKKDLKYGELSLPFGFKWICKPVP